MPALFSRFPAAIMLLLAVMDVSHAAEWESYHWARTTTKFTLQLGDNLTDTGWRTMLAQASKDWNSGGSPAWTVVVTGQAGEYCDMVIGTVQVCDGAYGEKGWLSLSSINVLGGQYITQGVIRLNNTYFGAGENNTANQKQHVLCQEVGHSLGLSDQSTDGRSLNTCMDSFSNTAANADSKQSTKPNTMDFMQLHSMYQYVEAFTTVAENAALNALSANEVNENPNSWGSLTQQSDDGLRSIYTHVNKDGSTTTTRVLWTEEAVKNCNNCDHRNN